MLELIGYDTQPVKNTFFRCESPASRLAVAFPGQGYTCAMPLLYYPTRLLIANGVDVLWVEYNYTQKEAYTSASHEERLRWMGFDAQQAVAEAQKQSHYEETILLGKSLGSFPLAHLASRPGQSANAFFIWLTPLLRNPIVQAAAVESKPRSLVILGDADPHYDAPSLDKMQQATGARVLLVPGANHSLEIPGNLPATLQAMQQTLDAIQSFIEE